LRASLGLQVKRMLDWRCAQQEKPIVGLAYKR